METNVYEQFAALERDHWWFRGRRTVYLGFVRALLRGVRPRRVLDLGCGSGGFQHGLRELGDEVIACDMDLESLQQCRRRGFEESLLSRCDALPFDDGSFDMVCMFDVLEHMEDDTRVLQEVRRVLRPGGLLVLSVPAYQFLYANNDRVAQHYRRYNRSLVRQRMQAAGLLLLRNSHSNVLLFPLILPLVLLTKLFESLFNRAKDMEHSNLSWPVPAFINQLLYRVFAAELAWTRHSDWWWGHSMIVAARKP